MMGNGFALEELYNKVVVNIAHSLSVDGRSSPSSFERAHTQLYNRHTNDDQQPSDGRLACVLCLWDLSIQNSQFAQINSCAFCCYCEYTATAHPPTYLSPSVFLRASKINLQFKTSWQKSEWVNYPNAILA